MNIGAATSAPSGMTPFAPANAGATTNMHVPPQSTIVNRQLSIVNFRDPLPDETSSRSAFPNPQSPVALAQANRSWPSALRPKSPTHAKLSVHHSHSSQNSHPASLQPSSATHEKNIPAQNPLPSEPALQPQPTTTESQVSPCESQVSPSQNQVSPCESQVSPTEPDSPTSTSESSTAARPSTSPFHPLSAPANLAPNQTPPPMSACARHAGSVSLDLCIPLPKYPIALP
jgi:hypothetical protein